MNEEPTKNLSGKKSFEERVFARFDAVDARLEKLESRSHDTKPIWERALNEILETRVEVGELTRKVVGLDTKVNNLDGAVTSLQTAVSSLQTEVTGLNSTVISLQTEVGNSKGEVGGVKSEMKEFRRELTRRLDQIQMIQLENRLSIGEAEERIDQLEAKLA